MLKKIKAGGSGLFALIVAVVALSVNLLPSVHISAEEIAWTAHELPSFVVPGNDEETWNNFGKEMAAFFNNYRLTTTVTNAEFAFNKDENGNPKAEFVEGGISGIFGNSGVLLLTVPESVLSSSTLPEVEVTDIGTITFKNAATINDKSIDVILSIDRIKLNQWDNPNVSWQDHSKVSVAVFQNENFWVGGGWIPDTNLNGWEGAKEADITTKVIYSDTQSPVDLKFVQLVKDLDYSHQEIITAWDGYSGNYHRYPEATWTATPLEVDGKSVLQIVSGPEQDLQGTWEYAKGGIFIETSGGEFKTSFRNSNSAVEYQLYSPYRNSSLNPNKALVGEETVYEVDEIVTFDVNYTMFKWYDFFTKFTKMRMYDPIPEGLDYVSAQILDGDGNDITATAGTLTEPSVFNNNTVSFTFNDAWLNDSANYNGKNVTMRINAKVNGSVVNDKIINIGYVEINNRNIPTNEVEIEVPEPEEITTTSEITTPEITTPEITTPEITTPEITTPEITTPEVTTTTPGIVTLETTTPSPGYGVIVSTASGTPPTSNVDLGAGVSDITAVDHQEETTVYFVIAAVLLAAGTAGAVSLRRKSKR